MHVAVFALLKEVRVVFEVELLGVFQNKKSFFLQQFLFENQIGQIAQSVQIIRRVGKDEIIFMARLQQKLEHIGFQGRAAFEVEVFEIILYKLYVQGLHLNTGNRICAAREALYGKGTRAAEQIQHFHLIKIHQMIEHIEKSFAGEVRCGAAFEVLGNQQASAFQGAGDYAHSTCRCAGKEAFIFLPSSGKAVVTCELYVLSNERSEAVCGIS